MNQKYNLVDTTDKLIALDKILMDGDTPRYGALSVDTETNGLLLFRSTVVGFSVSFNRNSGYYIPFLKWIPDPESFKKRKIDKVQYESYMDGEFECIWTGKRYPEFVKPHEYDISSQFPLIAALAERWFSNTNLWMWNAPFDVNMFFSNLKTEGKPLDFKNSLMLDGSLMTHILDENESTALKSTAERYKAELGINPHAMAAQEKAELVESIRKHGGKSKEVWRAELGVLSKYACADTFLTHGLCEVAIAKFHEEFGDAGIKWFFEDEVMPLCKEVVIDMKRRGVYTDVAHFEQLQRETQSKLDSIEDEIVAYLHKEGFMEDFTVGKSLDEAVSRQRLIKKIIELEDLPMPKKFDKKANIWKDTLAKGEVKKVNNEEPHWIWGYILGEDEIKYSDKRLEDIKKDLYTEVEGRRYRFNVRSDAHLRWLFCDKLGFSKTALPQTDSATKDNPIPSMKAEVLEEYMLERFPWVKELLLYKKLQKLQSSYINNAVNLHLDGWLYMNMKQNGTKSGRFSCSGGFNLQTLPKVEELDKCSKCFAKDPEVRHSILLLADVECKSCGHIDYNVLCSSAIKAGFVAPPGYKIVNADYSSLEPRCFAYMSGDDKIKDVYKKNLDLYSQIYCTMFPDGANYSPDPKDKDRFLKKVAPEKRNMVKPIVLGIPYGASAYQVAYLCGYMKSFIDKKTGQEKTIPDTARGAELRDMYLETFSDLHNYMKEQERKAVEDGFVTTIVGRKRHFQYAKKINDVLKTHNINYKDISETAPFILKKGLEVEFVSERGNKVILNKQIMTDIRDALKLDWEKIYTKGLWGYIRNLLKADINEACNNPIQGLAAHITNKGMLDTTRGYRQNNIDAWVCLQVHDEITSYARIDQVDQAVKIKQKGMEDNDFAHLIDVPMIAAPGVCDTLKESK